MINFTVGPVMSEQNVLEVASQSTPYFRTSEFSEIMKENEQWILEYMNAPEGSRCVFLTASGTGAMESCVMNVLHPKDKVIVINGGSFGQRFVDLCKIHQLEYQEIPLDFGKQLTYEKLNKLSDQGFTALLINMHETSSGVLYDMPMVSDFCKKNKILLIVDAISAFLSDEVEMDEWDAAAVITGSQKALAVQPGVSVIALAPQALKRIEQNEEKCLYLSLKQALVNGERGQTPFTPAVTTLLQIHERLLAMRKNGGVLKEREKIASLAEDFRNRIKGLPFEIVSESFSNAVTTLHPVTAKATDIVRILKDEYQIWVCPNGGEKADEVFRVGHIGALKLEDNTTLINALKDMEKRGLL